MSLVDDLRNALKAPASIWMQFSRLYRPEGNDVYAFFEGEEDTAFYLPQIRQYVSLPARIHFFICWGKPQLLAVRRDILHKSQTVDRVLFFVDADLDLFVGIPPIIDPKVFQTDFYSIENYLTTHEVIRRVWTDFLALSDSDPRFALVMGWFEQSANSFVDFMQAIMAWIIYHRKLNSKLNLNNVSMDKIIEWRSDLTVRRSGGAFSYLRRACGIDDVPDVWKMVLPLVRDLQRVSDPREYIRGHFALWHFVGFVNRVVSILSSAADKEDRPRTSVQLTESNAVALLTPKIATPKSLEIFLKLNLS